MNILEEKIIREGTFKKGNIVKVDGFLNHLVDIELTGFIADEIAKRYTGSSITKIMTVETSGIAIATLVAAKFNVPMLIAKKNRPSTMDEDTYSAKAYSFTHNCENQIIVSKRLLLASEKILIIDDFLAEGEALSALIEITQKAGADVVGCAVAIEKGFQKGGRIIREKGYRVESIATIGKIDYQNRAVAFIHQQ